MSTLQASKSYLVLMAGNPNSGKSTLFNLLTGLNQRVGNYPGVTLGKIKQKYWTITVSLFAAILALYMIIGKL